MKCYLCGNEADKCICENCISKTDVKELATIKSLVAETFRLGVNKDKHALVEECTKNCMENEGISDYDKAFVCSVMLAVKRSQKEWAEAEVYAEKLQQIMDMPQVSCYNLAEYYIATRRYEKAEKYIALFSEKALDESSLAQAKSLAEDCRKRKKGDKKPYLPQGQDDRAQYISFIRQLGIEIADDMGYLSPSKAKIKEDEYPEPEFVSELEADSFVAYDLETTGLSEKQDCIVSIGAVKVVAGKIVEGPDGVFKELVHPYAGVSKMSDEASEVNGITWDMAMKGKSVIDVMKNFAVFAGDLPLVGFNNQKFDSVRLRRAGRYAGVNITNKQFDVMNYCLENSDMLGINQKHIKLEELSKMLDIDNPNPHDGYADAWTTAMCYLKIRKLK